MNFFEHQHQAQRQTSLLFLYFVLAVLLIVLGVNLVAHSATLYLLHPYSLGPPSFMQWMPVQIYVYATVATLFVIGIGSAVRMSQLSQGGAAVAKLMGGTQLTAGTQDPDERRLLNIVEEMAIASGVQIPDIFVLREEPGINAFAAGYSPNEAAVAVTQGALKLFSRDELQGVIAHEFSHILNGDMRLNIRLMGVLNGILVVGAIGGFLLRSQAYARHRSREGAQSASVVMGIGLALFLLGYAGIFFGRLIKAAVSRQREFLADASAVQFTRNTQGIARALQKIHQHSMGSLMANRHTEEMSHMLFGEGLRRHNWSQLMATHPPLEVRIERIDPSMRLSSGPERPTQASGSAYGVSSLHEPRAAFRTSGEAVIEGVGQLEPKQIDYAQQLLRSIPEHIVQLAHSKRGAKAVLLSLLAPETPQLDLRHPALQGDIFADALETFGQIKAQVAVFPEQNRIALIDLSLHSLRELSQAEKDQLLSSLKQTIQADNQITLFEFVLFTIVSRQLGERRGVSQKIRFRTLGQVLDPCRLLISVMAIMGHQDGVERKKAFQTGTTCLDLGPQRMIKDDIKLADIQQALNDIHDLAVMPRMQILKALVETALTDNQIHTREAEFLRAVAEALDCPIPPLLKSSGPDSKTPTLGAGVLKSRLMLG